MAEINTELVKALREETGVSVMQCRKALVEADGDMEKARFILRKISAQQAEKKADRELGAGIIQAYIHGNKSVGVMLELNCETDFVAKNNDFNQLAADIAMHIAAMAPQYTTDADITDDVRAKVAAMVEEETASLDKPADIKATIIAKKIESYFAEKTLMNQAFIKNPDVTIGELINQAIQKLGEKIEIGRFTYYSLLGEK